MIIENNKIRTGTRPPFGWEENTLTNRLVYKRHLSWLYDKPLWRVIYEILIRSPLGCLKETYIRVGWWKLRCALGYHQKDMYSGNIFGEMYRWCFWCNKRIGKRFKPKNRDDYKHVICGAFHKKTEK